VKNVDRVWSGPLNREAVLVENSGKGSTVQLVQRATSLSAWGRGVWPGCWVCQLKKFELFEKTKLPFHFFSKCFLSAVQQLFHFFSKCPLTF